MTVKIAKKQIYKKCLVVFICLLIVGNLAHGVVLCFDSDGQINIESAFHKQCDDSAHPQPTNQKQLPYQSDHIIDENCEPCVNILIYIDLAKISRVSKQLNTTFPIPVKNMIVLANKVNLFAYNSALSTFDASSYFTPLRAVIFLI